MTTLRWILCFLRERQRWLYLLFVLTGVWLLLGWLDHNISLMSMIYVCMVQWLIIVIFLGFTYVKETHFVKQLERAVELNQIKHRMWAETPFQKIVLSYLEFKINHQQHTIMEQQEWLDIHQHSLTEFVHDIKTPVTSLKLLIEKEADDTRRQQLMYEWGRIDYMLVQQLFLSRINHKAHDLYFEKIPLKSLVIEEVRQTLYLSMAKGIDFDINLSKACEIYTDKRWMRMVIRQFISNAVKYSDHSTITIQNDITSSGHTKLSIIDQGCGIPEHDLPRIFQRGFTSSYGNYEATASGMGLYLVEQVREVLGLQINVTSTLHKGTTIEIIFSKPNEMIERMSM